MVNDYLLCAFFYSFRSKLIFSHEICSSIRLERFTRDAKKEGAYGSCSG